MAERKTRTKEERIAEIDKKIESHKKSIETLEAKKEAILNPKPRTRKIKSVNSVIAKAKEAGLTPEEIAKKLGLEI